MPRCPNSVPSCVVLAKSAYEGEIEEARCRNTCCCCTPGDRGGRGQVGGHVGVAGGDGEPAERRAARREQSPPSGGERDHRVRVRGGGIELTDGPLTVTREFLAGYYVLICADLDEALRHAARMLCRSNIGHVA